MHSTSYVIRFVLIMTTIVAFVLALLATGLKPIHDKNATVYNRRAILSAVNYEMSTKVEDLTDAEVGKIFDSNIEAIALDASGKEVDKATIIAAGYASGNVDEINPVKERKKPAKERLLPVFIFTNDEGNKYYITSMAGSGLWDAIWGNIALESDLRTIVGVSFDHAGETPGLGAEIKDNQSWKDQFIGKTIYSDDMKFRGIEVKKSIISDKEYQVSGISGATITSDGVEEMVQRGLKQYENFFISKGLKK